MKDVLHSERLRLTALNPSDAAIIAPWFERDEFARFYDTYPAIPLSERDIAKTIDEYNEDDEKMMLGLRLIEDDRLVGLVGFTELLWSNQVGTIFVGLGDPSLRGKGYASEAVRLVVDYSFSELNLHRLQLYVVDYNESAISLYEKLGFKREGIFREFGIRDGGRYNQYVYGILRDEWNARKKSEP